MAVRFRKSIKLAPGIRMNLSGGGLSWTLGPRGASVGIGKRGTFLNAGIPGTGLSSRQSLTGGSSPPRPKRPSGTTTNVSLTVAVENDGQLTFKDANGHPVSDAMVTAAKKQQGDAIMALIQGKCFEINAQVAALGELHHDTPPPNDPPVYRIQSFPEDKPHRPTARVPGFWDKLFKKRRQQIEADNETALANYDGAIADWKAAKARFDADQRAKQHLVAKAGAGDPAAMEEFFGEVLMDITWPRETSVSFEVRDRGTRLAFDVDLPEIEDMPTKTASVPQRGYKLSIKEMGPTSVQKLYAQHIHSIAFRLLGEAFATLPTVNEVTLSGYSQRKSKVTGHEADDYLLSVVVSREGWRGLNFYSVQAIDLLEAFDQFQLRRKMTKTAVFTAIEPFA